MKRIIGTRCIKARSSILVGKWYPLKAVCTHTHTHKKKKNTKRRKKKTIPFRENLLGSLKPLLGPVQLFVLGAVSPWEAPENRSLSPEA